MDWINVNDRLPDYDENVLWIDEQYYMFIAEIDHDNDWETFSSWHKDLDGNLIKITYWMKLPEPPNTNP